MKNALARGEGYVIVGFKVKGEDDLDLMYEDVVGVDSSNNLLVIYRTGGDRVFIPFDNFTSAEFHREKE